MVDAELEKRRIALRRNSRELAGHGPRDAARELRAIATWCEENGIRDDQYGSGEFLQGFEQRVAELTGFEAARFLPSGTMAQPIAMRIWSDRERCTTFGLHPSSHLELHEERGYAHLHGLRAQQVGEFTRPMTAEDLAAVAGRLSALLIELPTRENGGQLPDWDQLTALCDAARRKGIHTHLDGARIWEAQAAYGRPFADLCAGFDSAYVSFYKGIGALPGCMLLGPRDFIDEAIVWQRRQGGNLYTSLASAASASMRLETQIAAMPSFVERARSLGPRLAEIEGLHVLADPPQTNLFHLFFEADPETVAAARDAVAEETGLWLVGGLRGGERPGTARTEVSLYGASLELGEDEVVSGFQDLVRRIS